tara:strand:- start:667 stop:1656 length:990 start_codon:yes stop_codon:yes gene_type:complete
MLLIALIVVVGGITRLTGSGLSMVDWRPIMGILPPITASQWSEVFTQYQLFPEYSIQNSGMSLGEFKRIFFWEYIHRILGRLIGLSIILPFIYFEFKKRLSPAMRRNALIMTVLVFAQGLVGWYMVKSGLINIPQVSHFRLALHLGLALVLLQYCLWTFLTLAQTPRKRHSLQGIMKLWTGALSIQIIYGAFTAGLHAGWGYNTYPKMEGEWLPQAALMATPILKNILYNPVMIQFIHRHFAIILCLAFILIWKHLNTTACTDQQKMLSHIVLGLLGLQTLLGIATLVLTIPLLLALAHQFTAVLLLSCAIALIHSMGPLYSRKTCVQK